MVSDLTNNRSDESVRRVERAREGRTYLPNCDIIEKDNELLVLADMPGVRADQLDIQYERGLLTIQGRVDRDRDASRNYVVREYGVGDFHRSFEIGEGIDASRIEAEIRDGVLTLHLPKSEKLRPRKIAVKAS